MKAWTLSILSLTTLSACGPIGTTFSLLPEVQNFRQTNGIFNNQLDILFVVDNSDSMKNDQINLANNFSSFISDFKTKGYDFKIAVTSTDAYLGDPTLAGYNPAHAGIEQFRNQAIRSRDLMYGPIQNDVDCGDPTAPASPYRILTPSTPNLEANFAINALQCTRGVQDERAFSSMIAALKSPLNQGFLRPQSFLAVVILADEDDFSGNSRAALEGDSHNYSNPKLESVASYVSALDAITGSTPQFRRFNVSSISRMGGKCKAPKWMQLPNRHMQIADLTDGVNGDICDNFATTLEMIQNRIAELSTQFYLYRTPQLDTLIVQVDGIRIANDVANGWTYNPAKNSVVFHGASIPRQGSEIIISFTPTQPKI